jgi:outer membrane protein, heavy metal efflux system
MADRKEREMNPRDSMLIVLALFAVSASAQTPPPQAEPMALARELAPVSAQQDKPTQPPQAPQSPTLTLAALEDMAIASNPTLKQATAEVHAAESRKLQSGLYPNPIVGYQGEQIRGGSQRGGEQGFFVQQEIVLGGKLGLSRNIFEQERKQAVAEAEEQRLRIQNNVRILFYQALAAQRLVELRTHLSQLAGDAVETSHQLFNVGQADQPDVLQAEVEADQAQLDVNAAELERLRTWKSLAATVGRPDLSLTQLDGDLEATPAIGEEWLETILRDSPAVKIAELSVTRAEASLTRARREPVPNLLLCGGLEQNRERSDLSGRPVGLQGFAEAGVQIPLFNRNQGNVAAAKSDIERSRFEVQRIQLLLRERAAPFFQSYRTTQARVERYRGQMLPRAQKAYDLYLAKYKNMGAAYPQVLIAQRTLFQLQAEYVGSLQNLWTSALTLQGFLLTDGLEAPARPGDVDRPLRETNVPISMNANPQQ